MNAANTVARARADIFRFTAACYYEPGAEFVEERLLESPAATADDVTPELSASARRLADAFERIGPQQLLPDYARLFLGPSGTLAPPYGSVWLDGTRIAMGDSTADLQRLYDESGFELSEDFREPPDHIAAELELLYVLNFRIGQAAGVGDEAAVNEAQRLKRQLLTVHLGRWVEPFAYAMAAGAETEFYRELARFTEELVRCELRTVEGA